MSKRKGSPVDTGHKLNVHKTFRIRPGRPVSTGSNLFHLTGLFLFPLKTLGSIEKVEWCEIG